MLHATWMPSNDLFVWSDRTTPSAGKRRSLPMPLPDSGTSSKETLVFPDGRGGFRRETVAGQSLDALSAVRWLTQSGVRSSPSLFVWRNAARLALEMAVAHRVVPTVTDGRASWSPLLARLEDRSRLEAIVHSLPAVARSAPTRSRGIIRMYTARHVVRAFLATSLDALYRSGTHPAPTRGWPLVFADALRREPSTFRLREARFQGIPAAIREWSSERVGEGLQVGLSVGLPEEGEAANFEVDAYLFDPTSPTVRLPRARAWGAGASVLYKGQTFKRPGLAMLRGLARARQVWPTLRPMLKEDAPGPIYLGADAAWSLLSKGVDALQQAGIPVILPEAFRSQGARRIRARIRVDGGNLAESGPVELDEVLTFKWEVVLGERVLTGEQFTQLLTQRRPIARFENTWVLLDPEELSRLPEGLPQEGTLDTATALKAILTGRHEGVDVVADGRLDVLLDALRSPPPVAPPAGLKGTLRPYQLRGLAWLTTVGSLGLGACLADDMGLGKTLQLIAHILGRRESKERPPCLVVCPTSLLGNWRREIERFAPSLRVIRHHGGSRDLSKAVRADVVLTTYGVVVRDVEALSEQAWDVLALDEAQAIKNPDSRRAKCVRKLKGRHRVALTGTPVENRLDELWALLDFLVPGLLGSRGNFQRTIAVPVERFGDQDVAYQLKLGVSPFILRRLKSDPTIIDDLPDKIEQVDFCLMKKEQAERYREVVDEAMTVISGTAAQARRGQVLAMLTRLKQVCNHPVHLSKAFEEPLAGRSGKLERATHLMRSIIESGERVLVFTQYKEMGLLLQRHWRDVFGLDAPFLHGGVSVDGRDAMVARFQTEPDSCPILLLSLRAGGTGLNLTAATHVIHFDRWWNPAVEDQATDRAYRIGQTHTVQVHKMVTQGTLEERIDRMLEDKRQLAGAVVGTGEGWVTELDDSALRALVMLGEDAVEEA